MTARQKVQDEIIKKMKEVFKLQEEIYNLNQIRDELDKKERKNK